MIDYTQLLKYEDIEEKIALNKEKYTLEELRNKLEIEMFECVRVRIGCIIQEQNLKEQIAYIDKKIKRGA